MARDELTVRPERPDPDDRVLRVRVDVGDGCEVEIHAHFGELGADRGSDALRELDIVDDSERAVARIRAPGRRLEPRHVAAFFIDRDQDVRTLGAEVVRERAQLFAALDVPGVQDDSAETLRQPPSNPVRNDRAFEAREDAARGESLELCAHALTAPAVNPKAIFRCTRRKKITTGIAVRVEAAMRPPQSVFRLVP